MIKLQDLAFKEIHEVDEEYETRICGSFRRGASSSGDIDILITHPNFTSTSGKKPKLLKDVVNRLQEVEFITDTLSLGDCKFMVILQYF